MRQLQCSNSFVDTFQTQSSQRLKTALRIWSNRKLSSNHGSVAMLLPLCSIRYEPVTANSLDSNQIFPDNIGISCRVFCQAEAALLDLARSKRSRFITLFHAATKSWTNFPCASELA